MLSYLTTLFLGKPSRDSLQGLALLEAAEEGNSMFSDCAGHGTACIRNGHATDRPIAPGHC